MLRFGLYIHIPYCSNICPYCDFNVLVRRRIDWDLFRRALVNELRAHAAIFAHQADSNALCSVYFGGGTPSLGPSSFFECLMRDIRDVVPVSEDMEITVEVNPGDVDAAWFESVRACGVNRVSIGCQSTHNHLLQQLGRKHTGHQALDCVTDARQAGFENISVDLMYAIPGQTFAELRTDLQALIAANSQHVSLYCLTYHERTPFFRLRERGQLRPIADDVEASMFDAIDAELGASGFEHYEISNFAKEGFRARHNQLYWQGVPYLGVGPGAHSFVRDGWRRGWRWEGIRSQNQYLKAWQSQEVSLMDCTALNHVGWVESLSSQQLFSEYMMCRMRLSEWTSFGDGPLPQWSETVTRVAKRARDLGWLEWGDDRIRPTSEGLRKADALAALFFDD